ncbi:MULTISPECIES: GNAT family N-acetyltransferase [unclassified Parafrankia]|uniref:GNAT family N-acetyltransferase n=1 Tax=Parafrankia TaxID=2994362 RepID=UPI0000543B39|nr:MULTISPECIES: N-acetyltransferase [unclassified Parafrankia]ABW16230.1 GCN5-related N-acetyltransferase [Frankia sp. EAN1pec]TCJ32899.1 N-acetyltransferase [Parafrankia sp. BMG5.11]SQD94397.1 GCN5-related N-acetyltransferase [Parafrankia sp. Ea1.12]
MNTVKVRTVVEADLSALSRIDRQIFGRLAYPEFVLRQLFDVHQQEILVADEAGELLGYSIAVRSGSDAETDLAHFLALGVDGSRRCQGVGRLLALETLESLYLRGVQRVRLAVARDNPVAIHLYRSLGFEQTADVDSYYGADEPRLLFELNLDRNPQGDADTVRHVPRSATH